MGFNTLIPSETKPQLAVAPPPAAVICGFWRRLGAFMLDWLILAVPLEIFGWLDFDQLAQIGDRRAIVGIVVAVAYFGILGSSIGNGQTIGMRVGKIKVVDAEGRLLPLSKSLLRYTILWIPLALSGANMPNPFVVVIDIALFFIVLSLHFRPRYSAEPSRPRSRLVRCSCSDVWPANSSTHVESPLGDCINVRCHWDYCFRCFVPNSQESRPVSGAACDSAANCSLGESASGWRASNR